MSFEWDEIKNKSNRKKHGIWFEEALNVFNDPFHRTFYDESSSSTEDRFIAIGNSGADRILLLVYCLRSEDTIIRVISARKATKKERDFYEKRI